MITTLPYPFIDRTDQSLSNHSILIFLTHHPSCCCHTKSQKSEKIFFFWKRSIEEREIWKMSTNRTTPPPVAPIPQPQLLTCRRTELMVLNTRNNQYEPMICYAFSDVRFVFSRFSIFSLVLYLTLLHFPFNHLLLCVSCRYSFSFQQNNNT